jgi:hypothetical protein
VRESSTNNIATLLDARAMVHMSDTGAARRTNVLQFPHRLLNAAQAERTRMHDVAAERTVQRVVVKGVLRIGDFTKTSCTDTVASLRLTRSNCQVGRWLESRRCHSQRRARSPSNGASETLGVRGCARTVRNPPELTALLR